MYSSAALNDRKVGRTAGSTGPPTSMARKGRLLASGVFGGIETIDLRCPGETLMDLVHARHGGQLPRETCVAPSPGQETIRSFRPPPLTVELIYPECILRI